MEKKKIEATAELESVLWPTHEPKKADLEMVLGDFRNHPPNAVKVDGIWYAVGYSNNFTSYAGGGTGPINCRLYKAESLKKEGFMSTIELAEELSKLS